MIEVRNVDVSDVVAAPWRDSWAADSNIKPLAIEHLLASLKQQVADGATLPIHVAEVEPFKYTILDGHFLFEVYQALNRVSIDVLLHDDVQTIEKACERYISMNYLRSSEWLRSGVTLQSTLSQIGIARAYNLMQDPDLAKDLIDRKAEQWETFNKEVLLRDGEQEQDPEQQSFFTEEVAQ